MKKRYGLAEVGLVLLYVGLGLTSALLWYRIVTHGLQFYNLLLPEGQSRFEFMDAWHRNLIAGQAPAPNQYRLLTPWIVENVFLRLNPGLDVYSAYMWVRALFVTLTLICFDRYLRTWFSRPAAAAGAFCLAALLPFSYYPHFQESDPLNLLVIVLAFLLIVKKRDLWLIPLVLLGTLNRETALLIPAVYLLARWKEEPARKVVFGTALLTACWAVVFFGLRTFYGARPGYTEPIMWAQNLKSFLPTLFAFLVFGVLWILPWFAPKDAPALLRRTLWLVPPFVALHYLVAVVQEVRLFLPLAPILLPLSWWVLFPEARHGATPIRSGAGPDKRKR